ncbi:MAG: sigma-70 family RNA polymerase sigma factor [Verrucomicrobiota bacterium]
MMDANEDALLIREYVETHSEQAFETLLRRYLDLVYSAALRQAEDPSAADEIVQATFIILARKAGRLRSDVLLAGWLLRTVRFAAASHARAAARRRRYEKEAQMESQLHRADEPAPGWDEIAPRLDEAVAALKNEDRQALILRFYQAKPLKAVGEVLGVNEDAAQKRVSRALERLRALLSQRGITASTASLTALIGANSVQAAPAGLAAKLIGVGMGQGALASGPTVTVIKGALKMMAWAQYKPLALLAVVLFFGGSTFLALRPAMPPDASLRAQVISLIATNSWDEFDAGPQMAQLIAIGPRVVPVLGELLEWEPDVWRRQAVRQSPFLSAEIRPYLEDPERRREMQRKAAKIVTQIGAAAARPLASMLSHALDEPVFKSDYALLRSLYWSLPESVVAVNSLSNYLTNPSGGFGLFGNVDGDAVWPKLPQLSPWLIAWLSNLSAVNDAARGLAALGPKAEAALPALIEVAKQGFAGTPLPLEAMISYSSPAEPLLGNRQVALDALGRIQVPSPDVIQTLREALKDESVRIWALQGLVALGHPADIGLSQILSDTVLPRSFRTQQFIQSLAERGSQAEWALPWLERFTAGAFLTSLTEPDPEWHDLPIAAAELRQSAILAICRIRPAALPKYLLDVTKPFSARLLTKLLPEAKANAAAIQSILEPLLQSTNAWERSVAAEVLVQVVPTDDRAWSVLRHGIQSGSLEERLQGAAIWWKTRGEPNQLVALIQEALRGADPGAAQTAIYYLAELGSAGKETVSALQAALWYPDRAVRDSAGKALRSLAPESLTPIR